MGSLCYCHTSRSVNVRQGGFAVPNDILKSRGNGLFVHLYGMEVYAQPLGSPFCNIWGASLDLTAEGKRPTHPTHQIHCLCQTGQ